jgi:hypothetical protein
VITVRWFSGRDYSGVPLVSDHPDDDIIFCQTKYSSIFSITPLYLGFELANKALFTSHTIHIWKIILKCVIDAIEAINVLTESGILGGRAEVVEY